jgi:hypothetical protein
LVFAVAHFYWGLGGRVGLDVSAGPELASDRPRWFVAGGLFGVGILLVVAAALAALLERSDRPARVLRLLGWTAGLILLIRGIGIEILLATGVLRSGGGITSGQIAWTWILWNPWFVVGGICFLLATIGLSRRVSVSGQS